MPDLHLEVLVIAPHPDDAELFCGGLLAKLGAQGYRCGVLDLTRGERASRGTPALRQQEAEAAAQVLGLHWRGNLGLPDAGLDGASDTQVQALVEQLRVIRPELVLAPWRHERHPDHVAASQLAKRAVFLCGLRNWPTPDQLAHTVTQLLYYPMRSQTRPSFVVDIAEFAEIKARAVACHASQVGPGAAGTLVGSPASQVALQHRDGWFGAFVGCAAGEPYLLDGPLPVADPLAL
ncbi:MAG: bacillithiol biosynthesis deacetylase BshB1, partial [Deltaproteobacteria bacterium]|nr:bacillithiol biosynthesis deacetylase BshB1 [Deltaproteobacteria bacterium]